MQDDFVGDIGDFGKYGLLRVLTGVYPEAEPRLSLGVVWYLTDGVVRSPGDGQRLSYLDKPDEYRNCDPELFDCLLDIVSRGERSVATIQKSGILGSDTAFARKPEPQQSAVVFLDPDKGVAFSSAQNSVEHVYLPEVERIATLEQTVIIYQSFGRQRGDTHERQMSRWVEKLTHQLPRDEGPRILRFSPWHPRAFLALPAARHSGLIDERLRTLTAGPWGRHFTEFRGE